MPRGYNLSDRGRRTLIETMTRLNADPEFAAKRSAAATKELKRRHTDPNYNLNLARRKRRNGPVRLRGTENRHKEDCFSTTAPRAINIPRYSAST